MFLQTAVRARWARKISVFGISKTSVSFSSEGPMPKGARRQSGFAHRPLGLRRRLLELLKQLEAASAVELAGHAYSGRVHRMRPARCSPVQVATVRKALRKMLRNGNATIVGHHRGRRLYAWPSQTPLRIGHLDV
ncbi:hypothetical protein [Bradyrhizobium vignae]|uniref:hypothetical protein n=1 Tax=Bradyrhizobium vignae TaxID=1549949 RepID=UPI00100B2EDA|nr:hypothetical protein [Bradyrhizobium vignae]RXG92280.1 hypothetical protein EAV90_27230 [Bradyrhizobium vignae]